MRVNTSVIADCRRLSKTCLFAAASTAWTRPPYFSAAYRQYQCSDSIESNYDLCNYLANEEMIADSGRTISKTRRTTKRIQALFFRRYSDRMFE
jgi:hypothetical protein